MNAAAPDNVDWLAEYRALVGGAGLVDLGRRTQIEVAGADRATWLHNLTTNEIRKLSPGSGCESFLTTVQGKTLAHVFVFATPESLVIDTVPEQADTILAHLDHYLISERVTLADRTGDWAERLLSGPDAERMLRETAGAELPQQRLAHSAATLAGRTVWLRHVDLAGPAGFLVSGHADDMAATAEVLVERGACRCGRPAFEAARIEWGFPQFGADMGANNFPQEVARDALAISFVKGCYLGQETVARIDALGHVNKTLGGVRFFGTTIPGSELELTSDGKPAGSVTSATYSPALEAPLALAYLRRGANTPGTRLTSIAGDAEVVALPVR